MKSKIYSTVINLIAILVNLGLGLLLNFLFYKNNTENFVVFACGVVILSTLVIYLISQRLGFKLDISVFEIDDPKYLILNNIFIGNLFSIPLSMFVSILL